MLTVGKFSSRRRTSRCLMVIVSSSGARLHTRQTSQQLEFERDGLHPLDVDAEEPAEGLDQGTRAQAMTESRRHVAPFGPVEELGFLASGFGNADSHSGVLVRSGRSAGPSRTGAHRRAAVSGWRVMK